MSEIVMGAVIFAAGSVLGAILRGPRPLRLPLPSASEMKDRVRTTWSKPMATEGKPAAYRAESARWPTGTMGGLSRDEMP